MGGKGYKPRKDYAGRTVSGDWEDSDRGAGNKATRRAGGKVKKKSPTYQAYVLNKEHHQKDAEGKVIEHGDGTPSSVEEDYYRGTGEKVVARTKKFMDKKGQKGAPGLDAMKARSAEHKAKRGVKEEVIDERSLSSYIPSDRKAEFDAADREYMKAMMKKKEDESTKNRGNLSKRDAGKMAKERLHDKKHGRVFTKKEEAEVYWSSKALDQLDELNRYGKETGKATGSLNKRAGTPVKKGGGSDRALNFVRNKIRQEIGKPEGQQKKSKGEKGRVQYGDRKTTPADSIAKRRASKAAADAAMRDTRGT